MSTILHVDESGLFEDTDGRSADPDVVVAAWGFPADAQRHVEHAVRKAAASRWPILPWPLHRAHLFEPSWLVLCHGAWSRGREPHRPPPDFAAAMSEVPRDSASFGAFLDRMRSLATGLGLGDGWYALHAWGAWRGFELTGPGAETLNFCRLANAALNRAHLPGAQVDGAPASRALERALDRLQSGLNVPIRWARQFGPVFFPTGVPRAFRTAATALQRDTLALFEEARTACDRGAHGPTTVAWAAETDPGGARAEPDRYLALLRTLLGVVAEHPDLAPTGLRVEGRKVQVDQADGKGRSRLTDSILQSLLANLPDHGWSEAQVLDKRQGVVEWERTARSASQRAGPQDSGLLGSQPGGLRNEDLKKDRERRARWPIGLVLADFAAFELRYRLGLTGPELRSFVERTLHARGETTGRLHAGTFPGPCSTAARPWARRRS